MKNLINRMPEDTHGREVVSASLERGCLRAFLLKGGVTLKSGSIRVR